MTLIQMYMITHYDSDKPEETLYGTLSNGEHITSGRCPYLPTVCRCYMRVTELPTGGEFIGNYDESKLGVIL